MYQTMPVSPKILLVDDEPMVVKSVSRFLQTMGYNVTSCINGDEAVCETRDNMFDVAVVDFDMPGLSGNHLIQKLSELQSGLPIVIISGTTDLSVAQHIVNYEKLYFLVKPFDLDKLLEIIEKHHKNPLCSYSDPENQANMCGIKPAKNMDTIG